VDLPGYGYAQVSKDQRVKWEQFIRNYILHRANLMCLMVLIDSRLKPQLVDLEFMQWLGEKEVPFVMVFTKTDKLTKREYAENMNHYKEEMLKYWEELPTMFYTSSEKREGRKEILDFIEEANQLFVK
jgi:GTP-binding protein